MRAKLQPNPLDRKHHHTGQNHLVLGTGSISTTLAPWMVTTSWLFGPPVTLISDNGTQFTSEVFKEFCERNGIEHIRTPPFHPQSNGQAERFVDTFKRALRKIRVGTATLQESLDLFLQTYRSTPNPVLDQRTPAEIMLGRRSRTIHHLLRPPAASEATTSNNFRTWQPGDLIYAKMFRMNSWSWAPGRIVRRVGHVIYEIVTSDQRRHRRHVNQLRRRIADPSDQAEPDQQQLPLHVLLDEWDLPHHSSRESSCSSPPTTTQPAAPASSLAAPARAETQQTPASSLAAPARIEENSTRASSLTAPAEQQAPQALATIDSNIHQQARLPRRSSRPRRMPRRFDTYQLT
ncbi:uncharacterized protein K02A2.6-like [Anopheles funestus]|uniref:uncharacterized protein K02A2.6-like n=1 Tax=Anopheles funestus TaxID=62324 RepID=UPI0020C65AB2|nr:uncharacterized protein K02A2.6-like [Anopheles funestus]